MRGFLRSGRRLAVVGAALFAAASPSPAFGQASASPPPPLVVDYSTVPMVRNASLADAGVRLVERGADWGVDSFARDLFARQSAGGFFARFGRWLAFDFFVEAFASAAVHEYGHDTRVEESGRDAEVFLGSLNRSYFVVRGAPLRPLDAMSVFSGGLEGEQVLADRVGDRIFTAGSAAPAELTTLLFTLYASTSYVVDTLRESRLESPDRFLNGGPSGRPGDPAQYVMGLTGARLSLTSPFRAAEVVRYFPEIQSNARSIRRRTLLNLLDYQHVTMGVGLFRDYMWRGGRRVPVRWIGIGSMSIAPGVGYHLSPVGPETRVRSRYKIGSFSGDAHVRWSEPMMEGGNRLIGVGGEFQPAAIRREEPRIAFDLWRNPDGTTRARSEAAATFSWPGGRFVWTAAVGAKGSGYVPGYPLASGPYFSIGAGVRF
jgi:hypothetical protein